MVDAGQPDSILSVYARHRKALKAAIETFAVVKLELYFHDVYLTSATAFVYRYAQTYALVTSLHVLNGFNSNTQTYLDWRNFVPNTIKFYLHIFGDEIGAFRVEPFSVDLLRDGQPLWFGSAVDSPVIDVALIELGAVIENFDRLRGRIGYLHGGRMLVRVDEQANPQFTFHAYPRIGSDVFILGFPKGIGQGAFPIWKKGSIATEPLYGAVESGAPVVLIDAVTRDGMSGSPVLYFGSDVAGDMEPRLQIQMGHMSSGFMPVEKGLHRRKTVWRSAACGKWKFSTRYFLKTIDAEGSILAPPPNRRFQISESCSIEFSKR